MSEGVTYKIEINLNEQQQSAKDPVKKVSGGEKTFSPKALASAGILLQTGKSLLQYGMSSIEMYTGNSVMQAKVNDAAQIIGYGIGFAVNPLATGAMLAVNTITDILTKNNQIMWQNRQAEQLGRRSGNYLSASER